MSEPTKGELTALLQTWKLSCEEDCEKECNVEFMEDECKPCFDAIRSLIENMDMDKGPKASREFVERWAEDFFLSAQEAIEKGICWSTYKAIIPRIESMLVELGHEVEEEKISGGGR